MGVTVGVCIAVIVGLVVHLELKLELRMYKNLVTRVGTLCIKITKLNKKN